VSGSGFEIGTLSLVLFVSSCIETGEVLVPPDAGVRPDAAIASGPMLATGDDHACAIVQGTVDCWGNNAFGDLGLGDGVTRAVPTPVPNLDDPRIVAAGTSHTCVLSGARTIRCFGANESGELGTGDIRSSSTAADVKGSDFVDLASHFAHACALKSDETLWCWGDEHRGPARAKRPKARHELDGADSSGD
jgi:alpha-tubulin suppressor-like RCC1 family protein